MSFEMLNFYFKYLLKTRLTASKNVHTDNCFNDITLFYIEMEDILRFGMKKTFKKIFNFQSNKRTLIKKV